MTRLRIGVVLAAILVVGGVFTPAHLLRAQDDPHTGTWVLNVAKSKYSPGPAPKEQSSTYTVSAQSVKVATKAPVAMASRR
jgi:hypothetical protein